MTPLTWAFAIDSVEFTPAVIAGTASLGGSESACLGLARALAARGHHVCIFTTQLHADAPARDHAGVYWYPASELGHVSRFLDWDVFVALRLPHIFQAGIPAGLRILWNQDLLVGEAGKLQAMGMAWAYDAVAYVSAYHRKQWEGVVPELAPLGWVCKNGFDPTLVPTGAVQAPHRIIHISRPERGLRPLLAMWPALKARVPDAELQICRYNSMYDAQGWGRVCAAYDEAVAAVQASVGGLTYLGELGKPALYQAIAQAAVMWYPGVADFAETSCVAAIEAQACGTPFVGSYKGALPETVPHGLLLEGDADSPAYQAASVDAVARLLTGADPSVAPRVAAGRAHVAGYTFAAVAAEWEAFVVAAFAARRVTHGPAILARLLHEDDHVAARPLAAALGDTAAEALCTRVIDGRDQGAADYAERALDPAVELASSPRVAPVVEALAGATRVLDVACGNGAYAVALAEADPTRTVVGVDYAAANIAAAQAFAAARGVADRCTFVCAPVYDFATHAPTPAFADLGTTHGPFDGVFVGEFCEHVAAVSAVLTAIHAMTSTGARIVLTMPSGPFMELLDKDVPIRKGHVHHFRPADLYALVGAQDAYDLGFLEVGVSPRGVRLGHWLVTYRTNGAPVGTRDLTHRVRVTRPRYTLSVGLLAGDTVDLRRCLESIWRQADEILLGDTGADPAELAAIAATYPRTRIVPVGRVHDLPDGFAGARNAVLAAATGDWFLWIDTDERLLGAERLHRYLDGGVFVGYGLKQHHLMLDTPNTFDTPIRLFRRRPDIQFYGCIHEQPQQGDSNGDITPSLQLHDVEIAHTGYLNEDIRREKALRRNLPLLVRDAERFPDRRLGKVLLLREALNLGVWEMEAAGGRLTDAAKRHFQQCIALFETHCMAPTDKYHALARPFYEQALRRVAGAVEIEVAFAAGPQGLQQRARPERFWVRTPAHLPALLAAKQDAWLAAFQPPPPLDVAPLTKEAVS